MSQREIVKKRMWLLIVGVIAVVIFSYGFFQFRHLAFGPQISISSPADGYVSSSSVAVISGNAKNVAFINLDGRQIFTDTAGNFSEDVVLSRGYNVVTLDAKDTFGKETKKILELIYN